MNRFWKRLGAWLLCLMLMLPAALAEDCFTINVDTLDLDRLNSDEYVAVALSASAQGVRVCKAISESSELAASVRLTLTQMDTKTLLFDKNFGYQSGTFDSGIIYLPYVSDRTIPYLVTLYVGDYVYALPFMHQQRRMESNGASTAGVRLRDLDPAQSGDWLMGTMLDLNALRPSGSRTVDVCASNSYVIGQATIFLQNDELRVETAFASTADVTVEDAQLYVLTDGELLSDVRGVSMHSGVNVSGAQTALIYLPMQVSYDPAGLPAFRYDESAAQDQQALWSQSRASAQQSAESPQQSGSSEAYEDHSGWDDGWSSGWEGDWDDGWDDGWSSGW